MKSIVPNQATVHPNPLTAEAFPRRPINRIRRRVSMVKHSVRRTTEATITRVMITPDIHTHHPRSRLKTATFRHRHFQSPDHGKARLNPTSPHARDRTNSSRNHATRMSKKPPFKWMVHRRRFLEFTVRPTDQNGTMLRSSALL